MKNRIYRALMALLGFASFSCSCAKMYGPQPAPEYGVPYLELMTIKGTVTDPDGNPIPGIRVKDSYSGASVTTNASGKVELAVENAGPVEFDLYFKDPDGMENGGSFAEDTLYFKDMAIRQVDPGTFELNFEKKLQPLKDDGE